MTFVSSNVGCYVITSSLVCCHCECNGFVLCPDMSAVSSNVACYSITSSLLCRHLECKSFVLGPGMSVVPSNVKCCYSITSSFFVPP